MIRSDKIILRAPELKDLEKLYQWENDTSLWYLSNVNTPFSKFQLEQYILSAQQDIFAARQLRLMIENNEHVLVGAIDLYDFDPIHLRAGVGIMIDQSFRKMGYASEALELIKKYAFQTLHLKQLYCGITADNIDSQLLFQKQGYVACGIFSQWIRKDEQWIDEHRFQLINE